MSPKVLEYLLPYVPDGETLNFIRTVASEIFEVLMRQAKYYLRRGKEPKMTVLDKKCPS